MCIFFRNLLISHCSYFCVVSLHSVHIRTRSNPLRMNKLYFLRKSIIGSCIIKCPYHFSHFISIVSVNSEPMPILVVCLLNFLNSTDDIVYFKLICTEKTIEKNKMEHMAWLNVNISRWPIQCKAYLYAN